MALLDWDILPNFILFAFVLSVTPGPNNIITFFIHYDMAFFGRYCFVWG